MSRHDPVARVRHMLDYATEAVALLGDKSADELRDDRVMQLALTRLLEVIGEAASQIPSEFDAQFPDLPWRAARNLRNQLIHGYDVVRYDIIWQVVQVDLPPLIVQLKTIIGNQISS